MPEREQEITSIFLLAIEREGAERRAFLDDACANNSGLRREVEALISKDISYVTEQYVPQRLEEAEFLD